MLLEMVNAKHEEAQENMAEVQQGTSLQKFFIFLLFVIFLYCFSFCSCAGVGGFSASFLPSPHRPPPLTVILSFSRPLHSPSPSLSSPFVLFLLYFPQGDRTIQLIDGQLQATSRMLNMSALHLRRADDLFEQNKRQLRLTRELIAYANPKSLQLALVRFNRQQLNNKVLSF